MITLTYEYKLKPTQQQTERIDHDLTVCRKVWNYALRERKDWLASRKCPVKACSVQKEYIIPADAPYPGFKVQCQRLTVAKKTNPELATVNAQALQQVLRRLDQAFERHRKLGAGFPRFKKPNRMRSIVFPQLGKNPLGQGAIKLPGLGWMGIYQPRPYPEGFKVKQARVVKRASGYYVMLSFQAKDFHFKTAHQLCDGADVIVVEDLNLIGLSRGLLGKQMLDAGHGQFLNAVVPWVAAKRGKAVVKESATGTSQECPNCAAEVRKTLSTRWHDCDCGCSMPRDIASGQVLVNRYMSRGAHGSQNALGEVLAGDVLHPSQDSVNGESLAIHAVLAG